MGAVERFALPAWSPNVTFARGRNKRALVAVSLGRWTLPGLFSVFSHHGFQEEPTLSSGEPWRKTRGCVWAQQPHSCSYLVLGSAPLLPEWCLHWVLAPDARRNLIRLRPLLDVRRHYKELLTVTMATTGGGYHTVLLLLLLFFFFFFFWFCLFVVFYLFILIIYFPLVCFVFCLFICLFVVVGFIFIYF